MAIHFKQFAVFFGPNRHLFDEVWNQDTFTLIYKNRAIFPIQGAISFQNHQNHEGIEVGIVFFHLALQLQEIGHKILTINALNLS